MIQIEFQLHRDELAEATRLAYSRPDWTRPLRWAGYSGVAGGVLLLVIGPPGVALVAPLLLITLGLFVPLFLVWRGHRDFEKAVDEAQEDHQPHVVAIGDGGLRWSDPHWFSDYRWEAFDHFVETPRLLVLYLAPTNMGAGPT